MRGGMHLLYRFLAPTDTLGNASRNYVQYQQSIRPHSFFLEGDNDHLFNLSPFFNNLYVAFLTSLCSRPSAFGFAQG